MSLAKRLASSTFKLTVANAAVRLLAIVTMPILTRLLTPDAYGTATMLGTVISLLSVIALCGIDMSYMRSGLADPTQKQAFEKFSWRYSIASALVVALVGGLVWVFFIAEAFNVPGYLGAALAVGVILSPLNTMAQTRARIDNHYNAMTIAIAASGVVSAAASVAVAMVLSNELAIVSSILLGYLTPVLILRTPSWSSLLTSSGLSSESRYRLWKIGIAGIVTSPVYWVMSSLDRWFLAYYEGAESVGIYSIGYSVAVIGYMFNNALMWSWFPEITNAYERDETEARSLIGSLLERIVVGLGLVWFAVCTFGSDLIRLLAGSKFYGAGDVIPFVAAGVFFHGVLHVSNAGLFLKKKLDKAIVWWISGALACVLINIVMIPLLGRVGAAISQCVSFAIVALGVYRVSQNIYKVKVNALRLSAAVMLVGVCGVLGHYFRGAQPTLSILIKIPYVLCVCVLVGYLYMPKIFLNLVRKVKTSHR
jgi:O-antigen/teichoic acid export membrane protein